MRFTHASALGFIALFAGWAEPVGAQVQFGKPSPPVKSLLRNGTLVSLELDGGAKVTGHVVRVDTKSNEIFIRTKPGETPTAIGGNDIKKMEAATRPASPTAATGTKVERWHDLPNGLQENDRGVLRIKPKTGAVIRTVFTQPGSKAAPAGAGSAAIIVEPEIHKQVIYNGAEQSVVYASTVLSPAERSHLAQLQKVENEVLAVENQAQQRADALALEMALATERLRTQRLINFTLWNENSVNYPYPPATPNAAGLVTLANYKGVVVYLPQVVPPVTTILDRVPPIDPQAAAKAREDLTRLQGMAVYEDGRLAAVLVK